MAVRSRFLFRTLLLFFSIGAAAALTSSETLSSPVPKSISDLRDSIVKVLGFQGAEDLTVSGFDDVRDKLAGHSVAYEFDVEVDKKVIPFKLLEDVSRWDLVDLPIQAEKAVLPPFQIAGPIELWIQDADDLRLALPHDVDAGTLRKVMLSNGAAVTVKGARSVSLRRPLELPLPLNRSSIPASGLLNLAEALRAAARSSDEPLLSLRITGPSSLTSSTPASPNNKLKLKRLSPGLVQLSIPPASIEVWRESLWPLTSLNGSSPNLRGLDQLLVSVLGKKALQKGSFRLLRAEASAHTYVKMGFSVEKNLPPQADLPQLPPWKTRPQSAEAHFEVLARVDRAGNVVPERIQELPHPFHVADSVAHSVQAGNLSMTSLPLIYPPPTLFTL